MSGQLLMCLVESSFALPTMQPSTGGEITIRSISNTATCRKFASTSMDSNNTCWNRFSRITVLVSWCMPTTHVFVMGKLNNDKDIDILGSDYTTAATCCTLLTWRRTCYVLWANVTEHSSLPSVCPQQGAMTKWLIGSGCRLERWVGSGLLWVY